MCRALPIPLLFRIQGLSFRITIRRMAKATLTPFSKFSGSPLLLALATTLLAGGCAAFHGEKTAAQYIREGNRYYSGEWVARDLDRAVENYRKAAAMGDPWAYFLMGQCYDSGLGVPKNDREAADWYAKGAKAGNAEAEYSLGQAYEFGKGVPKNNALAYAWFNIAAASGHEKARSRRDSLGMRMREPEVRRAQQLSLEKNP